MKVTISTKITQTIQTPRRKPAKRYFTVASSEGLKQDEKVSLSLILGDVALRMETRSSRGKSSAPPMK